MAPAAWLSLLLLVLTAQDTADAQTFDTNATYQIAANFSDGIVASGIYVCDDVVSPRYACPNTSWTLLPASDGPMCLQLVDMLETFYGATQSCWNMGGRLLTITSETRQRAVESFIPFRYAGELWIGLKRDYNYGPFYWQGLGQYYSLSYVNDYYYSNMINHCCGYDCTYLTYPYRKWDIVPCYYNKPYICERDKVCVDGFVGDNCDQACHCYGEPCKEGQPCKYGCEAGWTGPYCYTRVKRAEVIYYCVNNTAEGRYALVRINPFGRQYQTVQLTDEAGTPQLWCSGSEMWYDDTGVYSVKIPVTRGNEWQVGFVCGGNRTGHNSYKWLLNLQEKKGVLLPLDRRVELSCDFDQADSTVQTQSQNVAVESDQPNNALPSVEKPLNSREFVNLAVTDSYSGQLLTRAKIGANVQLRMTLTTSPGLRAQGVSPYDCVASSGDGLYQLPLTDSDGCPAGGSTVISELRGHNGTVKSDPFQLFAFAGQNTLQIVCSFQFCFTREDALCTDRCNTRRMAPLTTISYRDTITNYGDSNSSYGDTSTYNYWTTTSYRFRKKREANSPEFATAVVTIIKEPSSTDTKPTASMAATNTVHQVVWATLLFLPLLCGFSV
ncbi:uncharacterized protein LOC112574009 [Pomacea canaliculata]|uniref:uncharacterized protein LOC112574009 n=1 Tax=Pomacea canaliculata TaxID=400727 RepID=UPI000D73730D|nr:uncharacterized protein LOC112574009 [Pomacea canaliculata]